MEYELFGYEEVPAIGKIITATNRKRIDTKKYPNFVVAVDLDSKANGKETRLIVACRSIFQAEGLARRLEESGNFKEVYASFTGFSHYNKDKEKKLYDDRIYKIDDVVFHP